MAFSDPSTTATQGKNFIAMSLSDINLINPIATLREGDRLEDILKVDLYQFWLKFIPMVLESMYKNATFLHFGPYLKDLDNDVISWGLDGLKKLGFSTQKDLFEIGHYDSLDERNCWHALMLAHSVAAKNLNDPITIALVLEEQNAIDMRNDFTTLQGHLLLPPKVTLAIVVNTSFKDVLDVFMNSDVSAPVIIDPDEYLAFDGKKTEKGKESLGSLDSLKAYLLQLKASESIGIDPSRPIQERIKSGVRGLVRMLTPAGNREASPVGRAVVDRNEAAHRATPQVRRRGGQIFSENLPHEVEHDNLVSLEQPLVPGSDPAAVEQPSVPMPTTVFLLNSAVSSCIANTESTL